MSLYDDMLTIFTAYAGKINQLKDDLGTFDSLVTEDKSSIVAAINELATRSDDDSDELLGTLPYEITERGCYLLSNVNAVISTGESMTDYMDYTRDDYQKTAFVGSATNSATTTIVSENVIRLTMTESGSDKGGSCIAQKYAIPSGAYTMFARVVSVTSGVSIEPIIRVANGGQASQVTLDTDAPNVWGRVAVLSAQNDNNLAISVLLGNDQTWLSNVGNYVEFELHIFSGTLDTYPVEADFSISAETPINVDGYIGRTLDTETSGAIVKVYKTSSVVVSTGMAFFGDSIFAMGQIADHVSRLTGISTISLAVGGTRMSGSRDPSNEYYPYDMTQIAQAIASDDFTDQINGGKNSNFASFAGGNIGNYGIFVLGFGTNDFSSQTPFEGNDITSIEGALKYIIETITTKYKGTRLIFVSTQPYITIGSGDASGVPTHPDGTVWEMNELIKDICESYNVTWIDMYHTFGMNRITRNTLTSDGVHLAFPVGVKRYAALLSGKLLAEGVQY